MVLLTRGGDCIREDDILLTLLLVEVDKIGLLTSYLLFLGPLIMASMVASLVSFLARPLLAAFFCCKTLFTWFVWWK